MYSWYRPNFLYNGWMPLFVVTRTRGTAWNSGLTLEGQADWEGHRQFMNRLEADGFVRLGGLLEGTPDVLLVIRAKGLEEIEERLAADPWTELKLLRTTEMRLWTLRLGSLP